MPRWTSEPNPPRRARRRPEELPLERTDRSNVEIIEASIDLSPTRKSLSLSTAIHVLGVAVAVCVIRAGSTEPERQPLRLTVRPAVAAPPAVTPPTVEEPPVESPVEPPALTPARLTPEPFPVDPPDAVAERAVPRIAEPAKFDAFARLRLTPPAPAADPATPDPEPAPTEPSPDRIESAFVPARALDTDNRPPTYPRLALRRGWAGEVWLRIEIDAAGAVDTVTVQRSSGHPILDRAAVDAVRAWRFEPARRDQRRVPSTLDFPVEFRLEPGRGAGSPATAIRARG